MSSGSAYPPPPSYYALFDGEHPTLPTPPPPPEPMQELPEETTVGGHALPAIRKLAQELPSVAAGREEAVSRAASLLQESADGLTGRRLHQAARALAEAFENQAQERRRIASVLKERRLASKSARESS